MVKCAECGFLTARNLGTRNLDEVEMEFRRSGDAPNQLIGGKEVWYPIHKPHPICFVQEYDLLDSFNKISGDKSIKYLGVVNGERQCKPFTTWKQGFTPKEHQEMLDRQWQLEFERKARRSDRKWRAIELIAFILAGAIVAIIAALIERGTLIP